MTATAISGTTGSSYSISLVIDSDNGFYLCKATNSSGTTNSNTVALTVAQTANSLLYHNTSSTSTITSPAPVISTQPKSVTVTTGTSVTFSLTASNATSYQWYKTPDASGAGKVFAQLRATLPSTYSGTTSGTNASAANTPASAAARK